MSLTLNNGVIHQGGVFENHRNPSHSEDSIFVDLTQLPAKVIRLKWNSKKTSSSACSNELERN